MVEYFGGDPIMPYRIGKMIKCAKNVIFRKILPDHKSSSHDYQYRFVDVREFDTECLMFSASRYSPDMRFTLHDFYGCTVTLYMRLNPLFMEVWRYGRDNTPVTDPKMSLRHMPFWENDVGWIERNALSRKQTERFNAMRGVIEATEAAYYILGRGECIDISLRGDVSKMDRQFVFEKLRE